MQPREPTLNISSSPKQGHAQPQQQQQQQPPNLESKQMQCEPPIDHGLVNTSMNLKKQKLAVVTHHGRIYKDGAQVPAQAQTEQQGSKKRSTSVADDEINAGGDIKKLSYSEMERNLAEVKKLVQAMEKQMSQGDKGVRKGGEPPGQETWGRGDWTAEEWREWEDGCRATAAAPSTIISGGSGHKSHHRHAGEPIATTIDISDTTTSPAAMVTSRQHQKIWKQHALNEDPHVVHHVAANKKNGGLHKTTALGQSSSGKVIKHKKLPPRIIPPLVDELKSSHSELSSECSEPQEEEEVQGETFSDWDDELPPGDASSPEKSRAGAAAALKKPIYTDSDKGSDYAASSEDGKMNSLYTDSDGSEHQHQHPDKKKKEKSSSTTKQKRTGSKKGSESKKESSKKKSGSKQKKEIVKHFSDSDSWSSMSSSRVYPQTREKKQKKRPRSKEEKRKKSIKKSPSWESDSSVRFRKTRKKR